MSQGKCIRISFFNIIDQIYSRIILTSDCIAELKIFVKINLLHISKHTTTTFKGIRFENIEKLPNGLLNSRRSRDREPIHIKLKNTTSCQSFVISFNNQHQSLNCLPVSYMRYPLKIVVSKVQR